LNTVGLGWGQLPGDAPNQFIVDEEV